MTDFEDKASVISKDTNDGDGDTMHGGDGETSRYSVASMTSSGTLVDAPIVPDSDSGVAVIFGTETESYLLSHSHSSISYYSLNQHGETPLHVAAADGSIERIQQLLDGRLGVHYRDLYGRTALHQAAISGRYQAVDLLLKNEAVVNTATDLGYTPLHCAALNGHSTVVQLLLNRNADPNLKDLRGRTALDKAAEYGKTCIIDLLIPVTLPNSEYVLDPYFG